MSCNLTNKFKDKIINTLNKLEVENSNIDKLSSSISKRIETKKGRVIFIGAGISAEMARIIIDEMWFNFQVSTETFISVTAAKSYAESLEKWKELEEIPSVSTFELEIIGLNSNDLIIGLTSSGKTQYVTSAIDFANRIGCETAIITDTKNSLINKSINHVINTNFNNPVVYGLNTADGSTIQKIILDIVIYTAFEKAGRIYKDNLVFMKPVSKKIESYCIVVIMNLLNVNEKNAKDIFEKYDKKLEIALISEMKNT